MKGEFATEQPLALADWHDPQVQIVYALLCASEIPPRGEHWEGYAARRIVATLRSIPSEKTNPQVSMVEFLLEIAGDIESLKHPGDVTDKIRAWVAERKASLSARGDKNTPGGLNRDVSAGTSHSEPDGPATRPATSSSQDGASQGAAPILLSRRQIVRDWARSEAGAKAHWGGSEGGSEIDELFDALDSALPSARLSPEIEQLAWDTIKEFGCHIPERTDVKLAKALLGASYVGQTKK